MKLSVVIPTCDRAEALRECLRRLQSDTQTLPREDYELIVSDDSRGQPAAEILQSEFPDVIWVPGPRRGPAANRNAGAARASGEVVVFLDDDCLPQPGLLAAYVGAFADGTLQAAEGRIAADRPFERVDEEAPLNEFGGCFWSCNIAIRRDYFDRIGRFDERFPAAAMEDVELRERILQSGTTIAFLREALVVHPVRKIKGWSFLRKRAEAHGIYVLMPTCHLPPPSYWDAFVATLRLTRRKFLPRAMENGWRGAINYSRVLTLPLWSTWHMKRALRMQRRQAKSQQ